MRGVPAHHTACVYTFDQKDMYSKLAQADITTTVFQFVHEMALKFRTRSAVVERRRRGFTHLNSTRPVKGSVCLSFELAAEIAVYEMSTAFFRYGSSTILHQREGIAMGGIASPALAWIVCIWAERAWVSSLRCDCHLSVHGIRYFDDCTLIIAGEREYIGTEGAMNIVENFKTRCYPPALRMEPTGSGCETHMLECRIVVRGNRLSCMHWNKNLEVLQKGERLLRKFLPYWTCHMGKNRILRGTLIGMLSRMLRNTSAEAIPGLLPVLLGYQAELLGLGYPRFYLCGCLRRFIRVRGLSSVGSPWPSLLRDLSSGVVLAWCEEFVGSPGACTR